MDPQLSRLEIYGTEVTLSHAYHDPYSGPNIFGGLLQLRRGDESDWMGFLSHIPRKEARTEWKNVPLAYAYSGNSRGVVLADMAYAVQSGRSHRANGDMAFHILEIMVGVHESSKQGAFYKVKSICERPVQLLLNM